MIQCSLIPWSVYWPFHANTAQLLQVRLVLSSQEQDCCPSLCTDNVPTVMTSFLPVPHSNKLHSGNKACKLLLDPSGCGRMIIYTFEIYSESLEKNPDHYDLLQWHSCSWLYTGQTVPGSNSSQPEQCGGITHQENLDKYGISPNGINNDLFKLNFP